MKKIIYCLSVVALLVLTACNSATFINPDKTAVDFTIDGGEESVTVSADGSWDVDGCPDWVKTDINDGVLVIKVSRNETSAVRSGEIILKGKGDVVASIKVTQYAKCTHITPASDKVEFGKEGGTQTINIDTDGALQVQAPEGFTASYAGGVLTVTAAANEEGAKRGEIKLSGDNQSVSIFASQEGNVCPKCGGSGTIACSKCGGKGYTHKVVYGEYGERYDEYYGCKKCGGYGAKYSDGLLDPYTENGYGKGSGKQTCPDCGGSGK